jgi:hypothetical protein
MTESSGLAGAGTLAVLHPGVEMAETGSQKVVPGAPRPAPRNLAPRLTSLRGRRLALFQNGKVNALEILTAVGKRLEAQFGVAETRTWGKPNAGESGQHFFQELLDWKPDLVLTGLGD